MAEVDYSNLGRFFSAAHTPTSKANDIAKFILLNADVQRGGGETRVSNEPSLIGRIFDILSRPRYAVANVIKGMVEHPGQAPDLKNLFSGLSGTQKTSFSDVLKSGGIEDEKTRAILGLGLDIGLDPVNFVPVAGIINKIKAGKDIAKAIPEVTAIQKLITKNEPINPELFGLPARESGSLPVALTSKTPITFPKDTLASGPINPVVPSLDLPGVAPRVPLPPITTTAKTAEVSRAVGQIPFKLDIKKSAPQIVDDAASGSVPDIIKTAPLVRGIEFEPRHAKLADEILGKFDPAKSTARINKSHPDTLNAKQQVWLYHRAINAAKTIAKKPEWVASHAHKIYAAMEESLRTKGYVPRLGSGENVSLYDVIKQMGGPSEAKSVLDHFAKDLSPKSPIWDAVEGLRAAGAVDEAKSVEFILDKAAEARATLVGSGALSDAGEKTAVQSIIKLANQAAKVAPISPSTENATGKLLNQILNGDDLVSNAKASMIDDILAGGRASRAEVNHSLTVALEKDHGKLPRWIVDGNKAVEFMMSRVATWWGQKDLRPLTLTAIGASSATAAARGKALDTLFKGYDEVQQAEAMAVVQGLQQPTSVHTARLADEVSKMMSNLVGQVSGTSVVTRSAVDMDMLNKWMRNYGTGFEFSSSKKLKDITGTTHDFSKGSDWLNSWKVAEVKGSPKAWLFKVQQAMEQATREKALYDELGERFGQRVAGGGFKTKIEGHPYLNEYYFSDDIAKQIPRVVKDWSTPLKSNDPLFRHYDRLLSMWKSGVTIYRPAHHIRNYIGDAYLGWMDGVNTVKPYMLAARVQRTMKDMYPTLSDVDRLVELGVVSRNMATPRVGETIFRNKSGVPFTAQQIAAVAHQKGLLEHARTIEDIIDLGESGWKPFGGKVQAVGRAASELTSHNTRLAHFIDKVMKSRGQNLEEIFEQASRRARKWHPSGLDLTNFEKKFMRRIIPFYSWMRKSTPLLLEGLVMNPGKVLVAPKAYGAIQESQGIETGGIADPFPVDQMFPEWLRAEGLGPLSSGEGWLGKFSNQQPPGYVMAGQGLNPLNALISQVQQPGKTLLGGLTPAAAIPITLLSGNNLTTGEPISGIDARPGAMQEYIGSQIPIWSMAQGVTGVTPLGTETKKSSAEHSTEAIINWLTGAGIKGTGPYVRQARYEKTRPAQVERAAQRQAFLEQLREMTQ